MSSSTGVFSSASVDRPEAAEQSSTFPNRRSGFGVPSRSVLKAAAVYFVLAVLLQWRSGAYKAHFSGYPDEPGHFTTGLMLRDYVLQGFPGNPLHYAENYYLHYPKVAIGHWPPLFHIFEALWLVVFPVSWASVMALMALYCAIDAALLYAWVAPEFGTSAGWLTGGLFSLLPVVRSQTMMVMAEGLLIVFVLLAVFAWSRYLESGSWRSSLLFGVFASLAILVKGNAWELALVPPLTVLLTRRFRLLKSRTFWIPVPVVMLICGPWQLLTAHVARQGWTGQPGADYFRFAVSSFTRGLWLQLTPAIALLSLIGIGAALFRRGGMQSRPACLLALLTAAGVFHSLTPTGPELRHILTAVPALLAFVPAGVWVTAGFLRRHGFGFLGRPAVITATAALFFVAGAPAVERPRSYGFEQAARYITTQPELRGRVVLASSDYLGEGLTIAETELHEKRPGHYILRATKLLARVDWSNSHYTALFPSAAAVRNHLNFIPVDVLVMDFTPGRSISIHQKQLLEMLASRPPEWRLAASFGPEGGDARPVRVYLHAGGESAPGHLQSILDDELHRLEEQ